MSLPKLEFIFNYESIEGTKYPIPIQYRPYNSDDEKYLLMNLQSVKQKQTIDSSMIKFIEDFISKCVVAPSGKENDVLDILKNMSYIDKVWLFFLIRAKSYSNVMKHSVHCDGCGQDLVINIDIEKDITLSSKFNGITKNANLPDGRPMDFVMRTPQFKTFGEVIDFKNEWESFAENKNDTISEAQLDDMYRKVDTMLSSFVSRIIFADEMYENEDVEDFILFAKGIPTQIKTKLLTDILNDIPQFCVKKIVKCNNAINYKDDADVIQQKRCDKEHTIDIKGVLSFL